jgi:hypothetical protein
MYKWLLIPPDNTKIDDVHYTNDKLEELMSGYADNQKMAAKMFSERKRDMIDKGNGFYKPGDENSQYYNRPDEEPISHPADIIEKLKLEKPDTPMEDLVKEADVIIAEEIKQRQKEREEQQAIAEEPEAEAEAEVEAEAKVE